LGGEGRTEAGSSSRSMVGYYFRKSWRYYFASLERGSEDVICVERVSCVGYICEMESRCQAVVLMAPCLCWPERPPRMATAKRLRHATPATRLGMGYVTCAPSLNFSRDCETPAACPAHPLQSAPAAPPSSCRNSLRLPLRLSFTRPAMSPSLPCACALRKSMMRD